MKAVIASVRHASVSVEGEVRGRIGRGLLILLGVTHTDTEAEAAKLAEKITGLRIFKDEEGRTNKSLADVAGEMLVVSQFTLYANCRHGRRPDFLSAAKPELALPLYESFVGHCRDKGFTVQTGVFGAYMQVESCNDGPFTLVVDTDDLK
ncbi:MAG: D-aminoacyl-tRNA deacylase [Oscillospiraceae bacterium]